jgi:predicted nuclease of predicted toxin-antitoxin system
VLFLADESCDAAVVRALRAAGHDVKSISETAPGSSDRAVLDRALTEQRVLLTEDKDFGKLVFAGIPTGGVILIRFPIAARSLLPGAIIDLVRTRGRDLHGAYFVVTPSRARIAQAHR